MNARLKLLPQPPATLNGTFISSTNSGLNAEFLSRFRDNTTGLSDPDILATVRYVLPNDPAIPAENMAFIRANVGGLSRIPNINWVVGLWPDSVCAVLLFPNTQRKPRDAQLLRAYRATRHVRQALRTHDQSPTGVPS